MPENKKVEENQVAFEDDAEQPGLNTSLGKSQKIAAVSLAFFAFLVIIFWGWQFKRSLSEPFEYKGNKDSSFYAETIGAQDLASQEGDSEEALRNKDTDNDGISDWDELYFYKTSPYLEDSDSDGFTDKEEIDNEKDPNCPAGRDCYSSGIIDGDKTAASEQTSSEDSALSTLLEQLGYDENSTAPGETMPDPVSIGALLGGELDAATLRQLLLQNGMQKEILDQISDEQLLASLREIMGE